MVHLSTRRRNILSTLIILLSLVAAGGLPIPVSAQLPEEYYPNGKWRTSTPAEQGMNETTIDEMMQYYKDNEVNIDGILIIRNGYLVLEEYPSFYGQNDTHHIFSCTKGITSALLGIAIDMDYPLSIDSLVLDYFPEKAPSNPGPLKESITVEHLLTMTTGLAWSEYYRESSSNFDAMIREDDWVKYVLSQPMFSTPGTEFVYNSGASHLLSAIIQNVTEMSSLRFAEQHLFSYLGIDDVQWETDPMNIYRGESRMRLRPSDLAKIGYLYLRNGRWGETQVISQDWVERSTTIQTNLTIILGSGRMQQISYGYQWWVDPRLGYYAVFGWGGQSLVVLPEHEIVMAIAASSADKSTSVDYIVEEWLLPSIGVEPTVPTWNSVLSNEVEIYYLRLLLTYVLVTVIVPVILIKIREEDDGELSDLDKTQ